MKPAHERNQECLPPKKRDLPLNNATTAPSANNTNSSSSTNSAGGSGVGGGGGGGGDEAPSSQGSGGSGESQGGAEWVRTQPSLHYGAEGPDGLAGLPVDQYSMLYKVALPSVTYSPTSLHPVLSHISPAYTVPSPLLQHSGIPYPPLGYTPIPHSSLQFVSPPYAAAVPYAVPPGFVPNPLISPQQPHPVSHLVPYPSVLQEGSPQQQVSAHVYTKVAAPAGVPLVLSSEQTAAQQQLGTVGVMSASELSPRGVPVFYHPSGAAAARAIASLREPHGGGLEPEREVNGGEREHGGREPQHDTVYGGRNARPPQVLMGAVALDAQHDRQKNRRQDGRASPGQRSTPDTDLEVQQVVGRLASPSHSASRRESAHGPSQSSQRSRDIQAEGRTPFGLHPAGQPEHRVQPHPQAVQPGHAVILANGQPVLVPLDYHHHQQQQQQQQQQHYPGQPNDTAVVSPYSKASDAASVPERSGVELPTQQPPVATVALAPAPLVAPAVAPAPSHFMKGAIIQLATGELKRVEDLQTQDFVRSAEVSGGLKIDSSMVVDIRPSQQRPSLVALHFTVGEQQSKVTIDVPPEHPFFVFGQGWSSCSPERTAQLYGLGCHHLQVGDVCVSVTLQQQQQQPVTQPKPPSLPSQQQQQQPINARTSAKVNSTSGTSSQPMMPPPPHHPRPQGQLRMERAQRERERFDREDHMQGSGSGHAEPAPRPNRTSAEHARSQSSYYLHTEGQNRAGTTSSVSAVGASQRRWSAPGFHRYAIKSEEGARVPAAAPSSSRPSFIPQEVKLSIEGRSNAGK